MSLGGGSKVPDVAKRPERVVDIQPEDIQIGDESATASPLKKSGKRSLSKPTGGAVSTGLAI